MIRAPFSLGKTEYKVDSGMIVYRSKMHKSLKRNYQIMPGAQWLELLLQHVPDKGEHLARISHQIDEPSRHLVRNAG